MESQGVDWIDLAKDNNKCQAPVTTSVNLRVP
jgi:hypothetical protein